MKFECQILGCKASSEIVALEVIGSTLRVDIVRGKLRTWFASVAVTSPFGINFT